MDLVPKPDQLLSAAGNVAHRVFYGNLADVRPMPRTLVGEGELRRTYHLRPAHARVQGDPVLLVSSLAAPSSAYDLRRGCSLAEHLVAEGHPTYLVEYGEVSFGDRALDMTPWVEDAVPTAIRETALHAGGRPVHLVGWSLGGIFALLSAAGDPELPIASITVLGSPGDVRQVPLVAPSRPLIEPDDGHRGGLVARAYQSIGAAPMPMVRWAFGLSTFERLVTKPLAMVTRIDDTDFLAQLEAVKAFHSRVSAYPGRTFGQLYHRFLRANALADGEIELGGTVLRLADVTVPVLVIAGSTDGIAPVAAVKSLVGHLTGSEEVAFEIVPGGHLGLLTGRGARRTTWPAIDDWLTRWTSPASGPDGAVADPTVARSRAAIGTSRKRRYSSEGSRALSR